MNGHILLRPHHSLCIRFFIGRGYSADFVRRMQDTIAMLSRDDPYVILTDGCDILCAACPHNRGGLCQHDAKVSAIDRRVLNAASLRYGDKLRWSKLYRLSYEEIIRCGRLAEVCADCQWRAVCDRQT